MSALKTALIIVSLSVVVDFLACSVYFFYLRESAAKVSSIRAGVIGIYVLNMSHKMREEDPLRGGYCVKSFRKLIFFDKKYYLKEIKIMIISCSCSVLYYVKQVSH